MPKKRYNFTLSGEGHAWAMGSGSGSAYIDGLLLDAEADYRGAMETLSFLTRPQFMAAIEYGAEARDKWALSPNEVDEITSLTDWQFDAIEIIRSELEQGRELP